jgi:low affinity Fe/Cu permease
VAVGSRSCNAVRKISPSASINAFAGFLSTATGFISTALALLIGVGVGWVIHFNDAYMLAFNLLLSIAAIVISSAILVSGARSEAALQVKLDHLIEFSKASNKVIGLEHRQVSEIEAERAAVEKEALADLDEHIEDQVEDEVTQQLQERSLRTRTALRQMAPSASSRS